MESLADRRDEGVETGKVSPAKLYIWAAVLLAIALRVVLLVVVLHTSGVKGLFAADTRGYVAPIHSLMQGSFSTAQGPELNRTPGYPIFLLATGMAADHPVLSSLGQILLVCLSVLLVFKIAILLFRSSYVAFLCALLYAVEPSTVLYSIELLSESLFTTFVLIFLYFLLKYLVSLSWRDLALAAIGLSATIYVRPVSYYLPLCCAAGLALLPLPMRVLPRLRRAAAFLAVCGVLVGAWQVRNYRETGYKGFSAIADSNLYFFNAGGVLAAKEHKNIQTVLGDLGWQNPHDYFAMHPEQAAWPVTRVLSFQKREGLRIIRENPSLYARLHLEGMAAVLFHPCATDFLWAVGKSPLSTVARFTSRSDHRGLLIMVARTVQHYPMVFLVTASLEAVLFAYYGFALFGVRELAGCRNEAVTLLLISLYFVAASGGAAGMARYRYPVMPIVCLFAGAGLGRLLRIAPRRL